MLVSESFIYYRENYSPLDKQILLPKHPLMINHGKLVWMERSLVLWVSNDREVEFLNSYLIIFGVK